jgi:hypothetical protein
MYQRSIGAYRWVSRAYSWPNPPKYLKKYHGCIGSVSGAYRNVSELSGYSDTPAGVSGAYRTQIALAPVSDTYPIRDTWVMDRILITQSIIQSKPIKDKKKLTYKLTWPTNLISIENQTNPTNLIHLNPNTNLIWTAQLSPLINIVKKKYYVDFKSGGVGRHLCHNLILITFK